MNLCWTARGCSARNTGYKNMHQSLHDEWPLRLALTLRGYGPRKWAETPAYLSAKISDQVHSFQDMQVQRWPARTGVELTSHQKPHCLLPLGSKSKGQPRSGSSLKAELQRWWRFWDSIRLCCKDKVDQILQHAPHSISSISQSMSKWPERSCFRKTTPNSVLVHHHRLPCSSQHFSARVN
jgi:hypothetical protein